MVSNSPAMFIFWRAALLLSLSTLASDTAALLSHTDFRYSRLYHNPTDYAYNAQCSIFFSFFSLLQHVLHIMSYHHHMQCITHLQTCMLLPLVLAHGMLPVPLLEIINSSYRVPVASLCTPLPVLKPPHMIYSNPATLDLTGFQAMHQQ